MRSVLSYLGVCALLALGCRLDGSAALDAIGLESEVGVSIARVEGGIRIVNGSGETFGYAVWNPNFLGLFAPCTNAVPDCPILAPGETITVADEEIVGYSAGMPQALVRLWTIVSDGKGGYQTGQVQELVVTL